MCFRRVVWGTGLRIFYVDAMVTLRRLTADYARAFVKNTYNLKLPIDFEEKTIFGASRRLSVNPTKSTKKQTDKYYHVYNYLFINSPPTKKSHMLRYPFRNITSFQSRYNSSLAQGGEGVRITDIESYTCDTNTQRYNGHGFRVDVMQEYKYRKSFKHLKKPLVRNNRPLRILFVSRGMHGRGRSLGHEQIIIAALRRNGAYVIHFTQANNRCLQDQLSMAYYADVVLIYHVL